MERHENKLVKRTKQNIEQQTKPPEMAVFACLKLN
jgi:hypothetical protein